MPKCPSCGKRELPAFDWFLYNFAECRACHKAAVMSRFVNNIVWRIAQLCLVSLVVLALVYPKLLTLKHVIAVGILGIMALLLVPKFSRPVPYTGEFPIGPSRSERLLAPVLLVVVAAFFAYAVYLLLVVS